MPTLTQSRVEEIHLFVMLVENIEKASFGSLKGVRINLKGYPSLSFSSL